MSVSLGHEMCAQWAAHVIITPHVGGGCVHSTLRGPQICQIFMKIESKDLQEKKNLQLGTFPQKHHAKCWRGVHSTPTPPPPPPGPFTVNLLMFPIKFG